jgi:type IV pilus assembly protein PilE
MLRRNKISAVKRIFGFTLIELMITIVIVGILAAISYPAYVDQMKRTRRSDGQAALLSMAARMEHYYTENNTYIGATPTTIGASATSAEGYYNMSISNLTATTYTLNATAIAGKAQATDTACTPLTLTYANVKGPNPTTCW